LNVTHALLFGPSGPILHCRNHGDPCPAGGSATPHVVPFDENTGADHAVPVDQFVSPVTHAMLSGILSFTTRLNALAFSALLMMHTVYVAVCDTASIVGVTIFVMCTTGQLTITPAVAL
jgi:hypothetical protein